MKTRFLFLAALLLGMSASAQIVYHDAAQFPLYGKATQETLTRYERLPAKLQDTLRKELWDLGRNSAGQTIRFRTNSTTIKVKWESLNKFGMAHMTAVGVRGLDLYGYDEGRWYYAGTAFPVGKETETTLVKNMSGEEREYMLHLSLYDGVSSLTIGVDSLATITAPQMEFPSRERPLLFYGTSILQGGCANRPGMAHTNILSRWLGVECINLGFSGNARLDVEIAEVIAAVENPGVIVLDFLPNVTVAQLKEKFHAFYKIVRQAHPQTPILLVENPYFPNGRFNQEVSKGYKEKNEVLHGFYKQLCKEGDKNVYFFSAKNILGNDGEATVDGCHFTDLGFMRYATELAPTLKKLMKK